MRKITKRIQELLASKRAEHVLGVISLLVFIVGAAVESAIVPVYLLRKRVGSHVEDINRLAFELLFEQPLLLELSSFLFEQDQLFLSLQSLLHPVKRDQLGDQIDTFR